MKFSEANERLNKIADGKYCAIKYELITHHTGKVETECGLYIEGPGWSKGNTFEAAFLALGKVEEIPDVEA